MKNGKRDFIFEFILLKTVEIYNFKGILFVYREFALAIQDFSGKIS